MLTITNGNYTTCSFLKCILLLKKKFKSHFKMPPKLIFSILLSKHCLCVISFVLFCFKKTTISYFKAYLFSLIATGKGEVHDRIKKVIVTEET